MDFSLQRPNLFSLLKIAPCAISTGLALTQPDSNWGDKTVATLSLLGGSLFALPKQLWQTYGLATATISAMRFIPNSIDTMLEVPPLSNIVEKVKPYTESLPSIQDLGKTSTDIGKGIFQGAASALAAFLVTFTTSAVLSPFELKDKRSPFIGAAIFLSLGSFLGFNELYYRYTSECRNFQYFTAQLASAVCIEVFLLGDKSTTPAVEN